MPRIPQSDYPIPIGRTLITSTLGGLLIGGAFYAALSMADDRLGRQDARSQEAFRSVRTASMEQGR